jgi:ABC-type transport system substrate-binding protein
VEAGLGTVLPRRRVIEGIGVGALGIAGAALLGCGSGGRAGGTAGAPSSANPPVTANTGVETLPLTAPVAQGKPRKGGTFNETVGAVTWVEHDSHTQRGASEWHVISEKLLECDFKDAKTLPSVATTWEAADPQGLTLVFKLRPGMKMHDVAPWNGRDFDAADVAWNLERIGGLYSERLKIPLSAFQRATMVQNIVKAEAVDKTTVKVTLSSPNSGLFAGISENRTMLMPKEMDDIGYKDPMKFGSMGPFQMADFKKDQAISFKKFTGYYRPNEPSFDDLVLQAIPDRASQLAAFATNQLQLWTGLSEAESEQVKKAKPDHLLYTWIDCNWNHVRPSMSYEPFKDFRVRNALHLALDYADIGNGVYGSGWGYQGPLSVGFPEAWKPGKIKALAGYNPDTKAADRAEANKLLTAAGFPNGKGLEFDMLFNSTGDTQKDVATRFQGQITTAFPELKLPMRPVDSGTFSTQQANGTFKALSYVITSVPDPVLDMISQYHSQGSRNYGKFNDPNLDALLEKALKELNREARTKLLDEFQSRWINEWRPMYVMHANAVRDVVQSNIGGFDQQAGTWFGYSAWTKPARWTYMDK